MILSQPPSFFKSKIPKIKKNELILGLFTFVVYAICLLNDFHTDDWIVLSYLRDGFSLSDFLSMENPGRFRPLTNILVYFRYVIFGDIPLLYYLLNISLHAVVSILMFRFLKKINFEEKTALISSLFFVVYFQHYEAVIWLYGTIRMLAAIFYILTLWNLHDYLTEGSKRSFIYFTALSFLGFFVVEDFVVAPLAFISFALLFSVRDSLKQKIIPVAINGILGLAAYFMLRSFLIQRPGIVEDYYYFGFHIFKVLFDYLGWFIIPSPSHPYFANFFSRIGVISYVWLILSWVAMAGFIPASIWIFIKSPKQVRFFILLIFITLLPIIPLNYKVTSRNIYLPSMGLAVVGGYLIHKFLWNKNIARARKLILGAVLLIYFAINIVAIDITIREYRQTQSLVRGIINDMGSSGLDFEQCDLVLLDHMPGRAIVGPSMIYRLNYKGSVIVSNDPINGPIDIKNAADSLYNAGIPFYLFDYRDGRMVEAKDDYVGSAGERK